jgi:23S rRNA pseudouridine2605 synthase
MMQLNKYLAHAGITSRRKAAELIKQGLVSINHGVTFEPGYKVLSTDVVRVNKKPVTLQVQNNVYMLLNKPKGYITSVDDDQNRSTVMDLLGDTFEKYRLYPIGRLDRDTTGLLVVTNDGTLAHQLSHPRYEIPKTYVVTLDKSFDFRDLEVLKNGIMLEDGEAYFDSVICLNQTKTRLKVTLHSGKNRIIRRIFAKLFYEVIKLDRIGFAYLTKKDLSVGRWRFLTPKEVKLLKRNESSD